MMRPPLQKLYLCMEEMRKIEDDMPVQRMVLFLLIAGKPGITYKELTDAAGVTNSTVSRNVAALGKLDRHGKPGHDLVETAPDPREPRRNLLRLTPKGARVAKTLIALIE